MEMKWYPAPAKLNLFLHVLGRRADGYHELQTAFRLIDRVDRVGILPTEDGEIRFAGEFGEDNLVVRAARLLRGQARARRGAALALEKAIPIGGGLGGGSSDAATVLMVLNRAWQLNLERPALLDIATQLGADVPLFVYGRNALGEGIGEQLTALDLPPAWYLVLDPQVSVSTKEIFAAALTQGSKRLKIPPFFSGQGRNDLEAAVAAKHPEVDAHLRWLKQRCPQARMTGSGACVFAEFESETEARALHAQLPRDMRGFVARGLDRHPLCGWND
ncbi:MAG TPA: 4-(cytidine 5'-diphospho)-2-C-methyl-D-erythritol kinase [Burkholderiales bacterium]|nr:4-(cytidine 5'-diphospho)-2-C-methyl-D-erythritol kinase [Burkholderiales bacterium]